ncbi:MAG: family 78 glycoside hydrolase catalytic domain [Sedimentisphaerales bacterium]|nr:family 78 glycoside hydrolase catalytic domain [Sedimentisphaerales bacterium]
MRTPSAILRTVVAIFLGGLLPMGCALAGDSKPVNLRCEYLADPLGIDEAKPRLSWTLESSGRARAQSAYRILVASDSKLLAKDTGDLWDSGKVTSDQSIQITYDGAPLKSQMQCHWKVRVWDGGSSSAWSKPACWTMGLLSREDWRAEWIAFDASRNRNETSERLDLSRAKWIWYPEGDATASAPICTRYFRTEFTLPAGLDVSWATCAVTADNSFKMFLNGRRIRNGDNFRQITAGDVKEYLHGGRNVLAIEAKNEGEAPNPAGVLAVLRVQLADGKLGVLVSDETWRTSDSAGPDWMNVDFNSGSWRNAKVLGAYGVAPWGTLTVVSGELFLPPVQYLRKSFNLDKAVARATVYVSALGNYELEINGKPVGDAYFTPGWTDYNVRVYYNTFDVTSLLKKGANAIGGMLADGWYSGHIGWMHIRDHYGKDPRFLAQLHVEYPDGTEEIVATDKTWTASTGPIREGDFLMGETYDARKEIPGWSTADFDAATWLPVNTVDAPRAAVEAYPGVLVREFRQITPVSMKEPQPQTYVFDMGTNFAGFVRLKVRGGKPGQKVVLRFAERLNPDGTIYTTNLRGARATDTYICKGEYTETWQPRFTFHGFQYVEITGYPGKPTSDTIVGVELTSSTPTAGSFECSDPMANTLYRNICQTQRANFIDIPTDCPQRDERLGWMGDAQIYVRTATYNADVSAFFTKWLVDVEDAQLENGGFSDVSPRKVAVGGGTAAWGDAGVICPWTIYQVYGDTRVLAEHYDSMQKWIDYCKGTTQGLLRPAEGYGDWLSIQADTPKDVLATAYFARSTKLMAQIAAVLGKKDDAQKYEQLFEDIRQAFNDAYVTPDGKIKGDTQTDYVLALAFDLLPKEKRGTATKHLVDNIRDHNWHLSTGFVGTKDLMATLTRFDAADVAYHLFHNESFPSWGFSIKHGATSIWERWDGWTPEKGFQDAGMNSFAHYSFGAVAEWMFKTIGGIDTDGPAYKQIIIHPQPGGRISWAKTSYDSIQGKIATDWKVKDGMFSLDVTIPTNTVATVYIPARDAASVREGLNPATKARGVNFVEQQGNTAIFKVGSGKYKFKSEMP